MVDNKLPSDEESLNRVFHCLADPSRRRILALLRESSELTVGDIAGAFEMSLNGVSKHLKVLESAHLVQRRVEGRVHYLRVNWAALQPGYEFLHFYQNFWNARLDGLVDYVTKQQAPSAEPPPIKPKKKKKKT